MLTGWLDRLPAQVRHYLFTAAGLVVTGLLVWAKENYTTWDLPVWLVGILASFLPLLVGYVTTWTQQYGRGKIDVTTDEGEVSAEIPPASPEEAAPEVNEAWEILPDDPDPASEGA
jgi:hypothetical protein